MKKIKCEAEGTIVIKVIKYAGDIIKFKPEKSLKIKYYKYVGADYIDIEYDFGMVIKEAANMDGFLGLTKDSSVKDIVRKTVTFDIEHAFCHPCEDPNYTTLHWAIKGWLKDRVDIL